MKFITKLRKTKDYHKKTDLWIDMDLYGEERLSIIRDMVLSMPKGSYHLNNREYGDNLVDEVYKVYGWMPSMLIDESLIMGMTILYPKKIYASFTHNLDIITIL